MQNTSAHSGANAQWASPVAGMYQHPSQDQQSTHQRQASNPRAYPGQDDRRDAYGSDQGMQAQQQSQYNYPQNYAYNAYANVNNLNYPNARRTSGTKATTPPPTAPVANQSPQYYNHRSDAYPTSAPPHMSAHSNQPQTAHPSYYPNFHDNASQSHQPWQQQQSYQAASTQGRTQATGTSSQTFGQGTGTDGNRAFDYTNQSFYPDRQGGFRPQYYPMHQQVPPGYPSWQQPTSSFYYGQQQQSMPTTAQPGLPGMPSSSAQANVPTPTTPIIGGKKSKGKKDDAAAGVLGKRSADAASEDEGPKDGSKKKKGKKDEEKPPPKPQPAKSHLHPPRQAQSAWQLFFTDELNKAKAAAVTGHSPGGTPQHAKLNVAQIAKDAGAAYGSLNDEQKAYYAEKVLEDKERFAKELVAWQATLTPEDIRQENAFRAQQRKEGKSRKGNLKDPNAPKKPLSAYFLFLKSIREDDDLRAKVWGEETETTKQSVLAAERWRGLSDEEKKPYLTQAEHDKQEYETARKLYEDDAAARARGEDVPERPIVPESSVHIEAPKSLLKDDKKPSDFLTDAAKPFEVSSGVAAGGATDFADMEEYHGFHDPLEGMDLTGLEGMAATDNHEGGWDELQKLMGTGDDKTQSTAPALGADAKPAPAPDAQTRQGALAAEGALSVPTGGETSSGVPTEDVSDQAGAADAVVKAE